MGKRRSQSATLAMPRALPYREARALRMKLLKAERQIAGYNTEVGIVYGPDGKERARQQGVWDAYDAYGIPNHRVEWSSDEAAQVFPGGVFTHNHPGGRSFSQGDMETAMSYDMAEMRAVDLNYRYSFRPPQHTYVNHQTGETIHQSASEVSRHGIIESVGPRGVPVYASEPLRITYLRILNETALEMRRRVQQGEIGLAEAIYQHPHLVTQRFAAATREASQPAVYRRARWPRGTSFHPEPMLFQERNQSGAPKFRWAQPDWRPEDGLEGEYGYGPGDTGPDGGRWDPEAHRSG